MSTPVRWGIAGWGVGGRVFHAPLVEAAEGLDLVAVVSSNPARADEARAAGYEVFPDLTALRAAGVEGVTITTPAGTHADLAIEALSRNLHVVVDKPFATTELDARRIVAAAGADTVLTVYQNRRWDGDFLTMRALVDEGTIGRVDRFESRIERFRPDLPEWSSQRSSVRGGGTLVDLGPHLIDQAVQLLGPVESVLADLSVLGPDRVSEDDVLLLLRHDGGARSTIMGSVHAAAEGPRFRISGSRGGARIEGFDIQEEQLFAGGTPKSLGAVWAVDRPDRAATLEIDGRASSRLLERGGWDGFYPAVATAISEGGPVPVDPADTVHVAAIFDAARASARGNRWIDVSSV